MSSNARKMILSENGTILTSFQQVYRQPYNIETHVWGDVQYIFYTGECFSHTGHMTRTEDGVCFWLTVGLHRTHKQHLDKWMVAGKGHGASGQYAPHPLVHKVSHLCRQK